MILVALSLAAALFLAAVIGFHFGQKSVRVIGTRTELLRVGDNLTTQRVIPEPIRPHPYSSGEPPAVTTFEPPPQFRHLVEKMRQEGEV
jgi:hypothetical protein